MNKTTIYLDETKGLKLSWFDKDTPIETPPGKTVSFWMDGVLENSVLKLTKTPTGYNVKAVGPVGAKAVVQLMCQGPGGRPGALAEYGAVEITIIDPLHADISLGEPYPV